MSWDSVFAEIGLSCMEELLEEELSDQYLIWENVENIQGITFARSCNKKKVYLCNTSLSIITSQTKHLLIFYGTFRKKLNPTIKKAK